MSSGFRRRRVDNIEAIGSCTVAKFAVDKYLVAEPVEFFRLQS